MSRLLKLHEMQPSAHAAGVRAFVSVAGMALGSLKFRGIVGDPRWEPEAFAFAGAGFRRAPVKFFPPSQLGETRAWISGEKDPAKADA